MNKATNVYVFDTSAWLTLIEDEAGVDTVQELLEKASKQGDCACLVYELYGGVLYHASGT